MTLYDVTTEVLRAVGRPLHFKKIFELASQRKLIQENAFDDADQFNHALTHAIGSQQQSDIITERPGIYSLRHWRTSALAAAAAPIAALPAPPVLPALPAASESSDDSLPARARRRHARRQDEEQQPPPSPPATTTERRFHNLQSEDLRTMGGIRGARANDAFQGRDRWRASREATSAPILTTATLYAEMAGLGDNLDDPIAPTPPPAPSRAPRAALPPAEMDSPKLPKTASPAPLVEEPPPRAPSRRPVSESAPKPTLEPRPEPAVARPVTQPIPAPPPAAPDLSDAEDDASDERGGRRRRRRRRDEVGADDIQPAKTQAESKISAAPKPEPKPEPKVVAAPAPAPKSEPAAVTPEPKPEPVVASPAPKPEPVVAAPKPTPKPSETIKTPPKNIPDAAVRALQQANKPLSNRALSDATSTPVGLLNATLLADNLHRSTSHQRPRFSRQNGTWALTEAAFVPRILEIERQIQQLAEEARELTLSSLTQTILGLSATAIQPLVIALLTRQGFDITSESTSQGLWVIAARDRRALSETGLAIALSDGPATAQHITTLRGTLHHHQASRGLVISPQSPSPDALSEAQTPNLSPIQLIDARGLAIMLLDANLGVERASIPFPTINPAFFASLS